VCVRYEYLNKFCDAEGEDMKVQKFELFFDSLLTSLSVKNIIPPADNFIRIHITYFSRIILSLFLLQTAAAVAQHE
jgi:hypothetical protein